MSERLRREECVNEKKKKAKTWTKTKINETRNKKKIRKGNEDTKRKEKSENE